MKLAISNIAWLPPEREEVYSILRENDVRGLEIAPALAFPDAADPFAPSPAEVALFFRETLAFDLGIVSMQSLLFGNDGARLFGTSHERLAFVSGIERAIELAGRLSIPNLVMGSPRNRAIPETMPRGEAIDHACDVFRRLGAAARAAGTNLAMEPNPAVYGTNFLNTMDETIRFVELVDHPNITLNFDIGSVHLNDEVPIAGELFRRAQGKVSHVHISLPQLAPPPGDRSVLSVIARTILDTGYQGWFSIEMNRAGTRNVDHVRRSVESCAQVIGSMT